MACRCVIHWGSGTWTTRVLTWRAPPHEPCRDSSHTAITATRQIFDSGDVSVPIKSWQLYVKTVDIDADAASVTLSVTNPLNNNIGKLYDPLEYTGLQYL